MDVAMLVDATFASPAEASNIILLGRGEGKKSLDFVYGSLHSPLR